MSMLTEVLGIIVYLIEYLFSNVFPEGFELKGHDSRYFEISFENTFFTIR